MDKTVRFLCNQLLFRFWELLQYMDGCAVNRRFFSTSPATIHPHFTHIVLDPFSSENRPLLLFSDPSSCITLYIINRTLACAVKKVMINIKHISTYLTTILMKCNHGLQIQGLSTLNPALNCHHSQPQTELS